MAKKIHTLSIVDPAAELDDDVEIGPFVIVGPHVRLGQGTVIRSHASIQGWTTIGRECTVFEGAVIGSPPQDLKYRGERSYVHIGDRTRIRECVTVHPGTEAEEVTRIGNDCLLMAYSHVAHNCVVEDRVVMSNSANLAGHIVVESETILGGLAGVHQFVRIGHNAFVSGCSGVRQDLIPFCRYAGTPARPVGINSVGLQRKGFSTERLRDLRKAYKILFHSGMALADVPARLRDEFPDSPDIARLIDFLPRSTRGLARPRVVEDAE